MSDAWNLEKQTFECVSCATPYILTYHQSGIKIKHFAHISVVLEETVQSRREASARAIMEKFVGKVDRGMAKSVETYAEMKEWLDDSC